VRETVYEPSLLRAIDLALRAADRKKKEIDICGELAGDPYFTAVLIGLGLRRLSMSPERFPEVRYKISQMHEGEAAALAKDILKLRTANEVRHAVSQRSDPWHRLLEHRSQAVRVP
jgi:phosphoenolpyruvate-protein kinase (PTS system EI component)